MKTVFEMREERGELIDASGRLLEKVEAERRSWTAEEVKEFNAIHEKANVLAAQIERAEKKGRVMRVRGSNLQECLEDLKRPMEALVGIIQYPEADPEPGEVRALRPNESLVDYMRSKGKLDPEYNGIGFGHYIRAMILGAKTDAEKRALEEGSDSAGGYTVPTLLSAELIDRLRSRATVLRAGARLVPLETDKTSIARLATDPTASWKAENIGVGDNDPTFERIQFDVQTLISLVRISRELLEDSVNIEEALRNAFAQAMALEVDRVALLGSGSAPEPRGIANTSNVGQISMGVNGAALTDYDKLLDALQILADKNAADPTAAIMAPRTSTTISKFKDTTTQPLVRPQALANLPFLATTQIPVDETQGTSGDASRIITGHFPELWIGTRRSLRIEVLKERYAENFQYGLLAFLRADVQLAHAESFCQIVGIIP